MRTKRIVYIDILRIVAIFGVILIHVSAVGIADYPISSVEWKVSTLYGSVMRWSVPVFFMISGAMFLDKDKDCSFKTMAKKYIHRIVACIIFWGFFYSFLDQYLYGTLSAKSLFIALWAVISNHSGYQLWFLYSILMLYLIVPILRIMVHNLTDIQTKWILGLWFAFSLGITQVNGLIAELNIGIAVINISVPLLTGYTGYFILGHYLHTTKIPSKIKRLFFILGAFAAFGGAFLNVYCSVQKNSNISGFTDSLGIFTFFSSVAVFMSAQWLGEHCSEKKSKVISKIAQDVFGIYLIHVFVNTLFFRIMKIPFFIMPVVAGIPLFRIVITLCSYVIVACLKKAPVLQKIV